jgi:hypothetical protein
MTAAAHGRWAARGHLCDTLGSPRLLGSLLPLRSPLLVPRKPAQACPRVRGGRLGQGKCGGRRFVRLRRMPPLRYMHRGTRTRAVGCPWSCQDTTLRCCTINGLTRAAAAYASVARGA